MDVRARVVCHGRASHGFLTADTRLTGRCAMVTQAPACERHGESTRLTCIDCDRPICPKCMVRTEVGLRCEVCAEPTPSSMAGSRPSRLPVLLSVTGLALLGVLAAVLLWGGSGGDEDAAPPPPVGTWSETPNLTTIRGTATASLLPDGRVLAAGGGVGAIALAAAETYDPTAGRWTQAASPPSARRGHQAVVLDDGRILLAGGLAEGRPLASAEIYDPAANEWQPTAPMGTPRLGHSLTLLPDGRVLAAGGSALDAEEGAAGGQTLRTEASSEIYDPRSGTWSGAGQMSSPRFEHSATQLPDGRVLMAGGSGPVGDGAELGPLRSTEIYDPAADAFVTAGQMAEGRTNHAAALLDDGSVLVAGGAGGDNADVSLASVEVLNPRQGGWATVASLAEARTGHTATRLDDGRVLVAGGESARRGSRRSLASAEVFEPQATSGGEWRPAGDMGCPRSEHAAVLLGDGSVLVVAGDAAFPGQAPAAQSCVARYRP